MLLAGRVEIEYWDRDEKDQSRALGGAEEDLEDGRFTNAYRVMVGTSGGEPSFLSQAEPKLASTPRNNIEKSGSTQLSKNGEDLGHQYNLKDSMILSPRTPFGYEFLLIPPAIPGVHTPKPPPKLRTYSARCATPCQFLLISSDDFTVHLESYYNQLQTDESNKLRARVVFLRLWSKANLDTLLENSLRIYCKKHFEVFKAGQKADYLYLALQGEFDISVPNSNMQPAEADDSTPDESKPLKKRQLFKLPVDSKETNDLIQPKAEIPLFKVQPYHFIAENDIGMKRETYSHSCVFNGVNPEGILLKMPKDLFISLLDSKTVNSFISMCQSKEDHIEYRKGQNLNTLKGIDEMNKLSYFKMKGVVKKVKQVHPSTLDIMYQLKKNKSLIKESERKKKFSSSELILESSSIFELRESSSHVSAKNRSSDIANRSSFNHPYYLSPGFSSKPISKIGINESRDISNQKIQKLHTHNLSWIEKEIGQPTNESRSIMLSPSLSLQPEIPLTSLVRTNTAKLSEDYLASPSSQMRTIRSREWAVEQIANLRYNNLNSRNSRISGERSIHARALKTSSQGRKKSETVDGLEQDAVNEDYCEERVLTQLPNIFQLKVSEGTKVDEEKEKVEKKVKTWIPLDLDRKPYKPRLLGAVSPLQKIPSQVIDEANTVGPYMIEIPRESYKLNPNSLFNRIAASQKSKEDTLVNPSSQSILPNTPKLTSRLKNLSLHSPVASLPSKSNALTPVRHFSKLRKPAYTTGREDIDILAEVCKQKDSEKMNKYRGGSRPTLPRSHPLANRSNVVIIL